MPSFRSAKHQAEHAVSEKVALGKSRHNHKDEGKIHAVRTAQAYTQVLKGFTVFIQENRLGDLRTATTHMAQMYLSERQEAGLSQKTLDQCRQALQCHLQRPLERIQALEKTVLSSRSYTSQQIQAIAALQSAKNGLSTEIVHAAGLRAHELLTLRHISEQAASSHREWGLDRFNGRDGERYSVTGKGGLVREIMIPQNLVGRLEATRLNVPKSVTDRGVHYLQRYDIAGGKNWSTSFSRVSVSALGWSNGGHGLRHSYAQERMSELQGAGYSRNDALGVVAQELGHFSASTSEAYLR